MANMGSRVMTKLSPNSINHKWSRGVASIFRPNGKFCCFNQVSDLRTCHFFGHTSRPLAGARIQTPFKQNRPFSGEASVEGITKNNGQQLLQVVWSSGEESCYPYLWLRDSCQCEICFNPTTKMRAFLMKDLDLNITANNVQADSSDNEVRVTWSDGHVSRYPFDWLEQRAFTKTWQDRRRRFLKMPNKLWGAEEMQQLPSLNYNELLEDNRVLYNWLTILEETGICLLHSAPIIPDQGVDRIARRVAHMRETHYGGQYSVKAKENAVNGAYTTSALGLHTDLSCLSYVPGLQILYCIKQISMTGGENQFADGFYVANQLRQNSPEAFRLLCTLPVHSVDMGIDVYKFNKIRRMHTITLNAKGEVCQINFSNLQRDTFMTLPLEQVEPFFRALNTWNNLLYHPRNVIEHKLQPGEVICIDNTRVLHSRKGFNVTGSGERHLEGGYIDWDELRSRRRVLEEELQIQHV